MNETVSVIVPVFGVERYLDACVASVLAQTHAELEVFLIDDGSPDACPAMCDAWARRDPRVRVIHKANAGVSSARNAGLEAATGNWVVFVDGDDVIAPYFVDALLTTAKGVGAQMVVGSHAPFVADEPQYGKGTSVDVCTGTEILWRIVGLRQQWEVWGKIFDRALFDQIRFRVDIANGEDLEVMTRVCAQVQACALTDAVLYGYRLRDDGAMARSISGPPADLLTAIGAAIESAATEFETSSSEFHRLFAAYLMLASGKLEKIVSWQAWRGSRNYRASYRGLIARHWVSVRESAVLGVPYKVGLAVSRLSPTAFVIGFHVARRLKRVVPHIRRRRAHPNDHESPAQPSVMRSPTAVPPDARLWAVIVTFRRPDVLKQMLGEVARQTKRPDNLIVVDNDADPTIRVAAMEAGAEYLDAGGNVGPAGGIALAMRHVVNRAGSNDWLLCLDDDDPPWRDDLLQDMWNFAHKQVRSDPRTAAVGGVGGMYRRKIGIFRRPEDVELRGPVLVDVLAGGRFPFYRCAAIRDVGVFDERLFWGFEEAEYGLRLRQAGWSLYMNGAVALDWRRFAGQLNRPSTTVRSAPDKAAWRRYYGVRNAVVLARRYGEPWTPPIVALGGIVRGAVGLRRMRRPASELFLPLKGAWDGFTGRLGRTVDPGSNRKTG